MAIANAGCKCLYSRLSICFSFSFFSAISGSESWLFKMAITAADELETMSYSPKINVAWWLDFFPRLLVEVYSKGSIDDRARLLVQGAYCTRLANLLSKKKQRTFILVLVYVDVELKAERFLFFQSSPETVRYNEKVYLWA